MKRLLFTTKCRNLQCHLATNAMIKNFLSILFILICSIAAAQPSDNCSSITLQTDRSQYTAGDDVLFCVFILPTQSADTIPDDSQILVDISTANDNLVASVVAQRSQRIASGLITLPDTLAADIYRIKAYTSAGNHYCQREILVAAGTDTADNALPANQLNSDSVAVAATQTFSHIFLQTDRSRYISGDDVLFSIFFKPTPTDDTTLAGNDVMIDIATIDGRWITGTVAQRNHNFATGLLNVPDSLLTGYYEIRAYTNLPNTKNYYCQREVLITNRFGNEPKTILQNNALRSEQYESCGLIDLPKNVFRRKEKINFSVKTDSTIQAAVRIVNKKQWDEQMSPTFGECTPFNLNEGFRPLSPYDGILISGTVTDTASGQPIKDAVVFISLQDSVIRLRCDITDENGSFCTLLHNYYGTQQVFVNAFNAKLEPYLNAKIELTSSFNRIANNQGNYREVYLAPDSLELNKAIIAKAFETQPFKPQFESSRPDDHYEQMAFGTPTHTVKTEDYVSFQDFNEIAVEILPFIRIRKDKSGAPEMRIVTNLELKNIVNANPFVMVDGVPLTNLEPLLKCGSSKIKQIDTQNKPRYYGNVIFANGIMLVWTHKLDFWPSLEIAGTFSFSVQGFQPPIAHLKSQPSNDQIPDFRQTVYWNPLTTLGGGNSLEFELSDERGEFVLEFIGVDGNGNIVKDYKLINIK